MEEDRANKAAGTDMGLIPKQSVRQMRVSVSPYMVWRLYLEPGATVTVQEAKE